MFTENKASAPSLPPPGSPLWNPEIIAKWEKEKLKDNSK